MVMVCDKLRRTIFLPLIFIVRLYFFIDIHVMICINYTPWHIRPRKITVDPDDSLPELVSYIIDDAILIDLEIVELRPD
jgi:hypothetical protein